ncbi:MAG: hypothetical protein ABI947_26850 [Chloroflexota bacterium]
MRESHLLGIRQNRAVLACAVGSKADFIVSGDQDLPVLGIYKGIPLPMLYRFSCTYHPNKACSFQGGEVQTANTMELLILRNLWWRIR